MMKALSGALVSLDLLRELSTDAAGRAHAARARPILTRAFEQIGPASAARSILDSQVTPLLGTFGSLQPSIAHDSSSEIVGAIRDGDGVVAHLAVGSWGSDLWRLAATGAWKQAPASRWSVLVNGAMLRIVDRNRIHSRRTLDVDLQHEDEDALAALASLLRTDGGRLVVLERAVDATDTHRSAVGTSLQAGVDVALRQLMTAFTRRRSTSYKNSSRVSLDAALADALTIVYRILFLLFAEARGLVPQWHPLYRNSYTIEALRPAVERTARPAGVWQALQAISRLAHRGCRAGTLRVVPFNGRLFAPSAAPLAETIAIDDARIRDVLLAITTRPAPNRRERISYADLGVEQLGSVYEGVLDYSPAIVDGAVALVRSGRRKATGTFYTPSSMTEYLVRRTLAPLVRSRSPEALLGLRVLDPAMGSGAFLVAACRYLADAYEHALIEAGRLTAADVGARERAMFRRAIAQRCLYGVDRNPTAVQLARLSLWLFTLAADRPLTFLDHHLRPGNSLVGAAPHDVLRQPPLRRRTPIGALPLFEDADLRERLGAAVLPRIAMAAEEDDTAEIVRQKERTLAALEHTTAPLAEWRRLADAWCAAWFRPRDDARLTRVSWNALVSALRGQPSGLPVPLERELVTMLTDVSARERFFHWEIEFPEVFFDAEGRPHERPGFDAVIGNPPWDTLRASADVDDAGSVSAHALTRFSRDSGCYRLQGTGHANLYQLFAERALQLTRAAGRIGLLLPSGVMTDSGSVHLRTQLIERCSIDAVLSFDNREALFPIHRGVRFVLLTADTGGSTTRIQTMSGLHSPKSLDDLQDEGTIRTAVHVPVSLLRKMSGAELALPELLTDMDREIVARLVTTAPALGGEDGWACHFGRELNATDDRRHFSTRGLPVLEGKLLDPFRVDVAGARDWISRSTATRLLGGRAAFDRERLGYREVASASNKLTLIAAVIPPGTVTTHTVFCLKEPLTSDDQQFLCGMFNSFVANYVIRLRGGTHVTAAMMNRLPVPKPPRASIHFRAIVDLVRALAASPEDRNAYAELQGRAAHLYDLTSEEFEHVLTTFPLIDRDVRQASARARRRAMDAV